MEVSITRMSENGQVVIPSEIRKDAGIEPRTKFLVFNADGDILLKPIQEKALMEEFDLMKNMEEGERDIKEGRFVKGNTKMSAKEIVDLLLGG